MKSNSTIERPSLELGADEKEIDSFMIWYELTGHYELFKTGQACVEDTQEKYGEVRSMEAAIFIQWERRAKSDFFAKQLLKRFTGRSLN